MLKTIKKKKIKKYLFKGNKIENIKILYYIFLFFIEIAIK